MAVTTVATVASKLPWKTIILLLPDVAKAAKSIWNQWESKPKPEPIDPAASIASQIAAAAKRIKTLEANEKIQSEIVSQIAEQLEGLASGLKETAARQTLLLRLSAGSIVISVCALVVSFVL